MKRVDLYNDDEWAWHRGIKCLFFSEGNLAVVSTNFFVQWAASKIKSKPNIYLHLFGYNQEELWKKPIDEHSSHGLWLSPKGKYIIVSGEDIGKGFEGFLRRFLYLFTKEGKLIKRIEIKFDSGAIPWEPIVKFSADEKYVCVGNANKIILIELKNGRVLWTQKFPYQVDSRTKEYSVMANLDIDTTGKTIVFTTAKYVKQKGGKAVLSPVIVFLNRAGKMIGEMIKPVKGSRYSLKLSPNGERLFIKSNGSLFEYQVSYEK